jgi:lipopolysaccharide assembly outer membrane protein LptD (OstA)
MGANGKPDPDPDQNVTGEVSGTIWHIPWMIHDAKGKTIPALIADARQGEMNNLDDNNTMHLRGVTAQLFQEGVHSADIVADEVDANSADHIIIGTGHVRVISLTKPPDTVVTADKITWDPHSYIMVAVGHARVTQRPPKGTPITQTGGRITFDTKLQKVKVESR